MSDTICLDKRGDFYYTLDPGHAGPHRATTRPSQHPGCVWADAEVVADA